MKTRLLALVAALGSALLSFAVPFLPSPLDDVLDGWWPGFIFGLLVLATRERPAWMSVVFVVASTLVYWGAVQLVFQLLGYHWPRLVACTFTGALAAFVLFAVVSGLTRRSLPLVPLFCVLVIGALGGAAIGGAFHTTNDDLALLALLAGYVVWQCGFALVCPAVPWWWPGTRAATPAPEVS